ncbi:MAG: hypothetical protein M3R51_00340 [Candidatus Eremiobacteraeota bacterium]|nr:hypothetical protein [Candidatus Eremiobacteraeota bacterium]
MTLEMFLARLRAIPNSARLLLCAVGGLAVVVTLVAGVASHGARANLFASPLHPEQLTEVQSELASWNVPFTPLADNVIVDASARNALLLKLSLAGVPHAHVATTTEALANVGVLTPQAIVDAQARSGLAGDIEVGLRSVDGVDDARVIIAPAKVAEYADESARDASASVRLRLHSGAVMGRNAIAGVREFVAASVAGLDASHVTILDDRGVALTDGASNSDDGDALARSLQSALDAAFGAGVTIVRVHAQYSASDVERRDTRRLPVRAVPITGNEFSETYDAAGKRYEKHVAENDRGSDTSEIVSRSAPGEVTALNTAVLIDASRGIDIEKVRELSAATVGYSAKRGDLLSVVAVDFHRELQPKRDVWFLLYGAIVPFVPAAVSAIGLLLLGRFLIPLIAPVATSFAERASIERATRAVSGYAPTHVRGILQQEPPHAAAAIISALPAATAAAVLELYPQHEREAIVSRMQRAHSPLVPSVEEVLGRRG